MYFGNFELIQSNCYLSKGAFYSIMTVTSDVQQQTGIAKIFMDFAPCLWIQTASAWHNLWRNLARKILQNGRSSIDSEGQFFSMQCNFSTSLSVCQIDSVEWKTMRKKHVVTSFLLDPVFQRSHICTFPPPKTSFFWDLF